MSAKLTILQILLLVLLVPYSPACSVAGCLNRGIEVKPNFAVIISHEGRPLEGATVEIKKVSETESLVLFTGHTSEHGKARFAQLLPGDYLLHAEFLGITAALECFHVAEKRSRNAKARLVFEWGDMPVGTRRIAGSFLATLQGKGGTPFWNQIHPRQVPIAGANLKLRNVVTGGISSSTTDQDGRFSFDTATNGEYVLHVEGGMSDGDANIQTGDLLISLGPGGKGNALQLTSSNGMGGSCPGISAELRNGI